MNRFYDNAAYDFEKFAPKKNEAKVIRLPENRNRHRSSHNAGLKAKLKIGAVATIILTLIVIQIHGQIKNSEVCAQINAANEQITALKQEESRLNVELSSIVSFNNIENVAKERKCKRPPVCRPATSTSAMRIRLKWPRIIKTSLKRLPICSKMRFKMRFKMYFKICRWGF